MMELSLTSAYCLAWLSKTAPALTNTFCPCIVRERVSTATVLLLAKAGRNLKNLVIRRNAVILRCDWPRSPEWDDEFHQWLQVSARSYDATEKEVSQLLGFKWRMLSDKQFKALSVDVRNLN